MAVSFSSRFKGSFALSTEGQGSSEIYQSMFAARREGLSELLIITGTIRAPKLPGIVAL